MEKLLVILATLEPVILVVLSLAALALVPLIVKAVRQHLDRAQQQFAYDVAKGIADTMSLFADDTPTKVDNAIRDIARQVQDQLGRALKPGEAKAVKQAVANVAARAGRSPVVGRLNGQKR